MTAWIPPVVNERITGFEEAITNAGFEVTRIDTGNDYSTIPGKLRENLSAEEQIDAIMCADDRMAEQVLETLDAEGRNDISVYSVGGSPAVKRRTGRSCKSDDRNRGQKSPINMGKTAVKTAAAILEDGVYEPETYVETFFINKDNVDMYGTDGWQ